MKPAVVFDNVSKKFRRGERLDSLRDAVPTLVRNAFRKRRPDELGDREFWALRDVSFEIEPGEALGIIGPNGAGKSTTLKLLTKIMRPTVGRCAVHGRIGALIEIAAGFHPDLTGRENIYLQGAIMGMKRDEIAQRFDEIVEFAGVADFIDTPVKRYSSGMNARLGFSIAAYLRPQVLIIDEVLSVGDITFQQKCFSRMLAFLDAGVAIVFVSHNLAAVSQLCRQTLLLTGGRLLTMGPTSETLAAYFMTQMPTAAKETHLGPIGVQARVKGRSATGAWLVGPGERIELSVDVQFIEPIRRAVIAIVVWDVAQNLRVYGVTSDSIGVPLLSGEAGDVAAFEFAFAANLARGAYAIEVNVADRSRQQVLASIKPVAQFTVTEHVTHLGVANLFLTGTQTRAIQPA